MKNSHICLVRRAFCLLAAAAIAVAPNLVSAQEDGPFMVSTRIADVKSGAEADFEAAVADISAALGAGGRAFNLVFQRIRGANLPTYTIFTPDAAFNDLPPVELDSAMIRRVVASQNNNTLLTMAFDPAYATNVEDTSTPEFAVARILTVPPGNIDAFEEFLSDTVVPAFDAAGVMSRVGRVVVGASIGTFVIYTFSDSFPSNATQRLMQSMGERDYDRMIDQGSSLISSVQDVAYRYRDDLSYSED